VNIDLKYIWMNIKGYLTGATAGTVNVDINPLVAGVGFGYKC
jgi:outer membrane protein W